ncbi:type IX secretion system PorP/SprF family membrane protein [Algoriphagus aquaeductus]|uniref:Type IX secretion system PorP/SprF family membrane protein n=1 Tax=Algoriphagus aquaeductus TaxID=475299 RepID=A0A326S0E7_9BACT|nr:type IX secretion system membrane protein PorP/SprF [Algoriphagus aquaeductus]PZV86359.1 type IX secretion system PorP/SprF family membrane protein [Algoriphagus aquaeductus]
MKITFTLITLVLISMAMNSALAQDVQYSQFYANPLYLNPALTGASEGTSMGVNYRNQWPGLDQSFVSYSAHIDHYIFGANSGVGIIFNRSEQSMANLSVSEIGATYSYRARLGFRSFLRVGGQVSYMDRDAHFGNLVFGSQINDQTGAIGDFSGENLGADFRHQFVDYSLGLLFNNDQVWFGLSTHHITQPNISFLDGQFSQLPMKISAHGGYKFDLSGGAARSFMNKTTGTRELTLAFNYKNQELFQQLDLGAQVNLQPLVLGVWYRGIPVSSVMQSNHESVIALVGFQLASGLSIGYSHDFTLSSLGNANTGGANEISMRYSFLAGSAKGAGRKTSMPCFKY